MSGMELYTESGTYSYDTNTVNGCDSTAFIDLIINYSGKSLDSVIACDSYE